MKFIQREITKLRRSVLARNAGWMLAGQGAGVALQASYFVVLARLLGVTEYGVFVGAFAFTGLVAQYAAFGSGTLLLRYVSVDHDSFSTYWGNVLMSTVVMSGVLIGGLYIAAPRLLNSSSASLVLLAAISNCLCAPLTEQTARVFQTFERMRVTVILNLLTNLVRTLTVVGMFFTLHRATAWQWAVASTIVSALATVVAIGTVSASYGKPHFSLHLFRRRAIEGFGYSFASSTMSVYNDVDKTMLSHYGMNEATGIYSMAYRVVDMATIPIYSIREAVLPRFFKHGRDGIGEASILSFRLLTRVLPFSLFVALTLFLAAPLIPRFAGAGFAESVTALRYLCLIPVFRSVHIMIGSVLTGAGLQHMRTIAQVSAAVLNIGINLWAIPRFGWVGAAWASLITDGMLCVFTWGILQVVSSTTSHLNRKREQSA